MLHREFAAPPALRHAVKCLWYGSRSAAGEMEVMPDGYAEIIFHFGSGPLWLEGDTRPLPSPFLMGLLERPVRFHVPDQLQIVAVRCYPWAVFDLLGMPSTRAGMAGVGHPIAALQAGLGHALREGTVEQAMALLAAGLPGAGPAADSTLLKADRTLLKAGVAMLEARGAIAVREVAAAAHATVRTLERRFKRSSGRTVKDVAGLMRFEQVRNHLWRHPDASLASLAAQLGYADQSHLCREFKRYSGAAPSAFARQARLSHLYKPDGEGGTRLAASSPQQD
ncbi:helix-turn-helix domain-containing protein [Oxalobacteraceae bacterium A2-2]